MEYKWNYRKHTYVFGSLSDCCTIPLFTNENIGNKFRETPPLGRGFTPDTLSSSLLLSPFIMILPFIHPSVQTSIERWLVWGMILGAGHVHMSKLSPPSRSSWCNRRGSPQVGNRAGLMRAWHSFQEPVCSCDCPEQEPMTKGLREEELTLEQNCFLGYSSCHQAAS